LFEVPFFWNGNMTVRRVVILIALSGSLTVLGPMLSQAPAASLTWNSTGSGSPTDGSGAWNVANTNWYNGTLDVTWGTSATNPDVAVFGAGSGTAGTVAVRAAGVAAGGITFNPPGSGNYILAGGAITLTGTAPAITSRVAATIGSALAGTGGLTKAGSGLLALAGTETYLGTTTILGGTLRLAVGGQLPAGTPVVVTPSDGAASFDLNGQSQAIGGLLLGGATTASTAVVATGSGTLALGGNVLYSAANSPSGGTISSTAGGGLSLGGSTRTFGIGSSPNANPELTVTSPVSDGGAPSGIIKTGGGQLSLRGNNSFTGPVTVTGGQLVLAGSNAYSGATTISGGGTLYLVTASNNNIPNSPTITVGDTSAGSAATLNVVGVAGSGAFLVQSGQTLQGFGSVTGATTILAGGQVAAGNNDIGTLSTGSLFLSNSSTATFYMGTSGSSHASPGLSGQIAAGVALSLRGTLNLLDNAGANGQGAASAGSYELFSYSGSAIGSFGSITGLGATYHTKVTNNATANAVYADLYNYAAPAALPSINLGTIHVNGSFVGQALSIGNTAPAGSFTEGLDATFSAATGATSHGTASVVNLAGQATDNTTMRAGLGQAVTTSAGTQGGTVTVAFFSDGTNSGLATTSLGPQTFSISGTVDYYADPVYANATGSARLTQSDSTHYTLDFGSVTENSGTRSANFSVVNNLLDPVYQDALGGSFSGSSGPLSDLLTEGGFGTSGFGAFGGVLPGAADPESPTLTFDSNSLSPGSYIETITLAPMWANSSGTGNLNPIQLTVTGSIVAVPEPASLSILAGGGLGIAVWALRRRTRSSAPPGDG
jgi:autotransporter-associated beta strand protein